MPVLKAEIDKRAQDIGAVGTLSYDNRIKIAKEIREERDAAAFALLNEKYVKAIEAQNTALAANTAELMAWNAHLVTTLKIA